MISACRATGSRVSVTEVDVEYWSLVKAGLAVAVRGTRKICLAMMVTDMVRMCLQVKVEQREKVVLILFQPQTICCSIYN
jgi:hypothetical protein